MKNYSILAVAVVILLAGTFVEASTFVYRDDFETDKAKFESWKHSPFVDTVPDICLAGLLHYEPMGPSSRGLGFYAGFDPGFYAYLAYATIPQSAIAIGGSVQFYVAGTGIMRIYSSVNGDSWTILGTAAGGWYSMPIRTGDPVQFLMLEGAGIIDDLEITIEYKYSGGTGEPNDPYLIATPNDLNTIGLDPNDWDKHFKMIDDINLVDFTGTQFNIIGNNLTMFTGVFDGNGHKVWNFTWTSENKGGSLFGYVGSGGQIRNLGMENADVNTIWGNGVSGLAVFNGGTITNCYFTGGITGNHVIGGLVGWNDGTITNCYSIGSVSGYQWTGGLVGINAGTITDCYSRCTSSAYYLVGGLAGVNHDTITNCYSTGSVTGYLSVGGLVGAGGDADVVTFSFWDIETSDCNTSAGGTGKTTAEMKTKSTFTDAGWDFVEIWNIGENQTYPYLRFAPAGDLNYDKKVDFFDLAILALHWLEGT